jgi:chromosome segregation ATPase
VLALAACGPSQPAREAPVAKVEAESKAQIAKAESASKELVAKAESASKELVAKAEGQAKALLAKAEAEAAEPTKEASSLEAQLPGLEAKVDKLRGPADKARPRVDQLTAAKDACETKVATQAERAGAQLEASKSACSDQASQTRARCEDDCSAVATSCRKANRDRPNAHEQCNETNENCQRRCGANAERACAAYENASVPENRSCDGVAAQLAKASEPIAEYNAAVAELANTKSRAPAARQRAANALSRATEAGQKLVREATEAGQKLVRGATEAGQKLAHWGALPAETCRGGRFVVLEKGAPGDDGTGLVVDATTGLVWARKSASGKNHADAESYCKGRGMRLPTKSEALAITPRNECGWPADWYTWTSTEAAGPGRWWDVISVGGAVDFGGDFVIVSLCVR